jgi:hypothetical protein
MTNIKEFIYSELSNNTEITNMVWTNIFGGVAPINKSYPVIVFNRISTQKIDNKWLREENFQISCWNKSYSQNENIINEMIIHFQNLKKDNIKICNIEAINESYDKETEGYWLHLSVRFLILDTF